MTVAQLQENITKLKQAKGALILAHNYQLPEVQQVADVVGDSLALARAAAESSAELVIFCGVHFMAETAAVLCPGKRVLLPDPEAGCSLADSITPEQLRAWRAQHPEAVVVAYINTSAAVKAESDWVCTSANARAVIEAIPPERDILFVPDMFLGAWLQAQTGRRLHLWMGECHVHAAMRPQDIQAALAEHPQAEFLIHPECGCMSATLYACSTGELNGRRLAIASTDGMLRYVRRSAAAEFVIGTEVGLLYRLQQENPGKRFYPLRPDAICPYMKRITLEKVLRSLQQEVYHVTVPQEIAQRARKALQRMLQVG
ncbi:MAG: quinolinate synthase NadA [Candidatus Kapabacteria bacterium]|nr:quinolinate synthase NadA [Candidatus Kapabacteria bacterium]MCS7169241.1 quinolinate synthase NadA [Candidatus Kapabacteria bacterium]MDW7996144.1 quinolinate synthase NadA [Bacteroidota bacterium]MDW8225457.1 quinolinate synthase NadA [Bacteroidota bacterium]